MLSNPSATKRTTPIFPLILFATVALPLAGCNSGGDGSSGTIAPASAVVITKQNSPQVAGAGYQAVSQATSSSTTGSSALTGVVRSNDTGGPGLTRFAQQQIAMLASLGYSTGLNSVSAAVISKTVACDTPPAGGTPGTLAISVNDADNSATLTTGDTLSATFSNCYSSGQTISGAFSLSALTINGSPGQAATAWNASATFSFKNLKIADASGNYTVNGAFSFSGKTTDGVTITVSVNGTSLTVEKASGATLTLSNFKFTSTNDDNTLAYSEYGSGQVNDSALSGYVNFQIPTTTPFTGTDGQYPGSGSMIVTGANNSNVKVTAVDSTTVQLQVDTDGDGVVDYTITEPWSSLSL
jgi:hypothetical protein